METLKCKMCGAIIQLTQETSFVTCEYCDTTTTAPKTLDKKILNLFDRANDYRICKEFDKALATYETILDEDNTNAEAHWGCVISKYGIEYVEDPKNHNRIPTCHRLQSSPILSDLDYKKALEYADSNSKELYIKEATEISEIQKRILSIANQEAPYDIFICFKEADETGKRTIDSAIAQDIYFQLQDNGYKVFFSRITLEDKLGQEYEPYIFAALNSAKVMLVVGTKPEYFNATWVKNEWSRYLKIMKKDRSKLLIPCYKNMDAYDLPDEFAHLQAQDMDKIGFINDVVRGIKKVVSPKITESEAVVNVVNNTATEPLLKRAFIFLEDGDWISANEYCEKVLDIDPECAKAYLGKMMAELHIKKPKYLKNLNESFENNPNYIKIMRYADDELRNELIGYIDSINAKTEEIRKNNILAEAKSKMVGENIADYEYAIQLLESISGWKDSYEIIVTCKNKIADIIAKVEAEQLEKQRQKEIIEKENAQIAKRNKKIALITTPIVAVIVAVVILITIFVVPNIKYNDALALMNNSEVDEAYNILVELGNYKDADLLSKKLMYEKGISLSETDNISAAIAFGRAGDYEDAKEKAFLLWDNITKRNTVSVGCYYVVGISESGNLLYSGEAIANNLESEIANWNDIISVAGGDWCLAALKKDRTVVAVGEGCNGLDSVKDWENIVSITAGNCSVAGLKSDGTVVCTDSETNKQVSHWENIISIDMERHYILGLKSDGTVVSSSKLMEIPKEWDNIVQIAAGAQHCAALRSDGTVLAIGDGLSGTNAGLDVQNWKDVKSISAARFITFGVKEDGSVISAGDREYSMQNAEKWANVKDIVANYLEVACIHKDGTVSWIVHGQQSGDNEKWDLLG